MVERGVWWFSIINKCGEIFFVKAFKFHVLNDNIIASWQSVLELGPWVLIHDQL